jgi:DNA-binding winged helix-turn-helix (wHTH) protein/TolB-like protein/Tfp pilus assembly protein PilF
MIMSMKSGRLYKFDSFCLDASEHQLLNNREVVPLTPKVFETLLVLVENSGHIVKKEELITAVWPDSFVEESSLTQNISLIRKALGEVNGSQQFIETVPKRGYRFIAPVEMLSSDEVATTGELTIRERSATKVIIENIEEVDGEKEEGITGESLVILPTGHPYQERLRSKHWNLALGAALLLGLASAVFLWRAGTGKDSSPAVPSSLNGIHSVAILPLKPLGNESTDEHLGLGMADALIVKLSGFRQLNVLPTSTVYRYAEGDQDALAVGRSLGVEAVLVGTVQHEGERIRVTMMLLNVSDGHTLWSDKFDERSTDIFTLQDSISERVAEALSLRLSLDDEKLLTKRFTDNLEAYQSYLTGIYFKNKRTKDGLFKAVEYFQQAVARDPNYALAYAAMADCYNLIAYYGYSTQPREETYRQAKTMAGKALEIDNMLAETYSTLGMISIDFDGEFEKGSQLLQKSLTLNPNCVEAQIRYAWFSLGQREFQRALQGMKKAQELDPVSPLTNGALGQMLYLQGNYDEAIKFSSKALDLEPSNFIVHSVLALSYEQKGMYQAAIEEVKKAKEASQSTSEMSYTVGVLGYIYATMNRKQEALKILAELQQMKKVNPDSVSSFESALIYEALGEREKAVELLSLVYENEPLIPMTYTFDPRMESLRADPRFKELMNRRRARLSKA